MNAVFLAVFVTRDEVSLAIGKILYTLYRSSPSTSSFEIRSFPGDVGISTSAWIARFTLPLRNYDRGWHAISRCEIIRPVVGELGLKGETLFGIATVPFLSASVRWVRVADFSSTSRFNRRKIWAEWYREQCSLFWLLIAIIDWQF